MTVLKAKPSVFYRYSKHCEVRMETLPVTPKRKAEFEAYAQRHGQDTATALDEVLPNILHSKNRAAEGIRLGYEHLKAGRVAPVDEVFERLRLKHGFS